jgi:NADPH2 dehydrogenase
VYRVREGVPLSAYDRSVFYTPKKPEGYIDYPLSPQYLQAAASA